MAKFYDKRTLNHEQALAWVKQQIISMGFAFNETHIEAGIDAFAELADPNTGEARASFFGIQVKTCEQFDAETPEKFSFYTDGKDIAYWNSSTIPVLLVVCRAKTNEAYAVKVQEYFNLPENRNAKTVVFRKQQDKFESDGTWQRRLLGIGVPHGYGMSFPPVPTEEDLSSNLLEAVLPKSLYHGATKLKSRSDVITELRKHKFAGSEFMLRESRVWTVYSLHENAWNAVVDKQSLQSMNFADLAFHADPVKRRYAVELLNLCLSARLRRDEVRWLRDEEMYVYAPMRSITRRVRIPVRTTTSQTRRGLIFPSFYRGRLVRCRHLAFMANFLEIDGVYYLQIDPTYYFSRDGGRKHPKWEDLIRAARILQKERDYHSNLEVWHQLLTQQADFARTEYPFLSFNDYRRFTVPVSIPDDVWRSAAQSSSVDLDQKLLELFQ